MADELQGKTIAFLVANEGIEQVELTEPWQAVKDAGGTPRLVAPKPGKAQGFNHLDKADQFDVDATTDAISPIDFDAVVLPGGVANPDQLRMLPRTRVSFEVGFSSVLRAYGNPRKVCSCPQSTVATGSRPGATT